MDTLLKLESRKLKGLAITIAALLLLFAAYLIASLFIDVSEVVITAISSSITALGGGHQGAQMMADRSPNYNSPPQFLSQPEQPYAGPAPGTARV
jgi:hypothetical protein